MAGCTNSSIVRDRESLALIIMRLKNRVIKRYFNVQKKDREKRNVLKTNFFNLKMYRFGH